MAVSGELFATLARPLQRHVRATVRAPDDVVEDACQFAWSQLVRRPGGVAAGSVYGWLLSTAQREAYRLLRVRARDVSLDAELEKPGSVRLERAMIRSGQAGAPDELAQCREYLTAVRTLPVRQQRMLWLKALGLSQAEVSRHERCTTRVVDRQLGTARRALRARLAAAA